MRKTKIVCTLGPATDKDNVLKELMLAGMNVARFNFSHGKHSDHKRRLEQVEKLREELDLPVATMLDTKGPEIRVCDFENGKIVLENGQKFTLTVDDIMGNEERVSVTYKNLVNDVSVGTVLLMDDGLLELKVIDVTEKDVVCEVVCGGVLSNHKGVNVPNVDLSMAYISDVDREDIIFGIEQGFDFIAASFVRTADDVREIRKIFDEYNCKDIKIISKIENLQGVKNIDEIIEESDGIMVARGDMGVEIPNEDVPVMQKMIINKVYNAGKMVITATQMLDSMINNPRPTRAETADVANAIYDGTSAVMLSGESAAGKYPVESVKTMVKIAERTEREIDNKKRFNALSRKEQITVTDAISHATVTTAHDLNAKVIITVTLSGTTARMVSRYRPQCDIIACTLDKKVMRQLNLSWGVTPMLIDERKNKTSELLSSALKYVEDKGYIQKGDIAVMTAGLPLGMSGTTNMLKVEQL